MLETPDILVHIAFMTELAGKVSGIQVYASGNSDELSFATVTSDKGTIDLNKIPDDTAISYLLRRASEFCEKYHICEAFAKHVPASLPIKVVISLRVMLDEYPTRQFTLSRKRSIIGEVYLEVLEEPIDAKMLGEAIPTEVQEQLHTDCKQWLQEHDLL